MAAQAFETPRIFKPGDVFHQYVIVSFLAAGRAGEVYVVEHRFTGDRFALKVSHLDDRREAKKVARSLVEARATYRLVHRNVVRVVDLGCEDTGMVWQLMELLDGMAVGDLIARYGKISPLYAIDIALCAAWGLQAAHEQGIIHRDVHPWNVFVTAAGAVKVLDFSLAKVRYSGIHTTNGNHMGTAGYMALEGAKGAPPTPQLDVYSLGTLFWQMLSGRPPFESCEGNVMHVVSRQLAGEGLEPLSTLVGLPAYCDEVIRRATATDPRERYDGMWAFCQALLGLRERLAADLTAPQDVWSPPAWERRHPIDPDSVRQPEYRAPRALPRESPVPHVPSRRIVVSPAVGPARHVVATTVPMAVVDVPPGPAPARKPPEVAPPTIRARPSSKSHRLWLLVPATTWLVAVGVVAWVIVTWDEPAAPALSAVAPRASASAPAEARRAPAPRPKH